MMGIPHYPDILQRVEATRTQTEKGRYERWLNVSQAFEMKDPSFPVETPVLLVDDVLTTGSTLEACAQALLKEGKGPVAVATIACA
jgi:predicted amidophosphoribosyltransferase